MAKKSAKLDRWASMCVIMMAVVAPTWIAGCNTMEGVGEDIEATGDAIDDAAEDAHD